jgi:hypothetical protein
MTVYLVIDRMSVAALVVLRSPPWLAVSVY